MSCRVVTQSVSFFIYNILYTYVIYNIYIYMYIAEHCETIVVCMNEGFLAEDSCIVLE